MRETDSHTDRKELIEMYNPTQDWIDNQSYFVGRMASIPGVVVKKSVDSPKVLAAGPGARVLLNRLDNGFGENPSIEVRALDNDGQWPDVRIALQHYPEWFRRDLDKVFEPLKERLLEKQPIAAVSFKRYEDLKEIGKIAKEVFPGIEGKLRGGFVQWVSDAIWVSAGTDKIAFRAAGEPITDYHQLFYCDDWQGRLRKALEQARDGKEIAVKENHYSYVMYEHVKALLDD